MSMHLSRPLWQGFARACVFGLSALSLPAALTASPLFLKEAEHLILINEPGIERLIAEARAREEAAVAAGQLPDPVLTTGLMDIPLDRPGLDQDPMTQVTVGIRQTFPRGQSRQLAQQQGQNMTSAGHHQIDALRRQLLDMVRQTYLELYFEIRTSALLDESQTVFEQVLDISRQTFASGLGSRQDILRAELELEQLTDRRIESERRQARLRAELARWLEERASAALPASWPELPQPANTDLTWHPLLAVDRSELAARQSAVALAEQNYRPQWSLELGYGYKTKPGAMNPHQGSIMVMLDLPLFTSQRQDRTRSARQQEYAARAHAGRERVLALQQELNQAREDKQRLEERESRYLNRLIPVSEDNANAAEQAYATGTIGFNALMDARLLALSNRIEYLRIRTDRLQTHARLLYLLGEDAS